MTKNNLIENKAFREYEEEVDSMLQDKDRHVMRSLIRKIHSDYIKEERLDSSPKARNFKPIYYYLSAAVILTFLSIGGYMKFVLPSNSLDSEELFNLNYEPYNADVISRTGEVLTNETNKAIDAYSNKEYSMAIELFSQTLPNENAATHFYLGISYMEIGRYKQSLESFEKVLNLNHSAYDPQAHWYTALTWIKLNNLAAAQIHLNWLVKNDRYYSLKANAILAQINKQ